MNKTIEMNISVFKPIENYEGLYSISRNGKVFSHISKKWLNGGINSSGYMHVGLFKNKKGTYKYIHRLVAEAFMPNYDDLPEVNHKDEDKLNNSADNLEWCTSEYNSNYGTSRQRMIKNQPNSKKILCVETGKIYPSIRGAAREVGDKQYNIQSAIKRGGTSFGLHWQYV